MSFWTAVAGLDYLPLAFFLLALAVAFGFEFINGFHDTANAVATVIYTDTLKPTPAVIYSGVMNFLGVLLGGTAVAFGIVHLLPVELLIDATSPRALVMVLSLLLAGVMWNLGTWYRGLPVSSSHTLIGSILGVGLANSLLAGRGLSGVNWAKAGEVGLALLVSPLIGFAAAGGLLLILKKTIRDPKLFVAPAPGGKPPGWVKAVLIGTCGGVSFAHGSNDGQKGMGLLLLILIGFLPAHYALNTARPEVAAAVRGAIPAARAVLGAEPELDELERALAGRESFTDVPTGERWATRQAITSTARKLNAAGAPAEVVKPFTGAVEFVPLWVVVGTAVALGVGTTIGYKRIVVTVAEKIGKAHLTYAQGAAAEAVAAATILLADVAHAPVSTTHVLSSGVAGTMAANGSGIQGPTARKILLAWVCTLPATVLLAGGLFAVGRLLVG